MGIIKRTTADALKAAEKAEATAAKWDDKAAAVRAEAQRMDDEAGAAILADESQAERITLTVQAQERKARAYDSAAAEARREAATARDDAVRIEADDLDRQADQLEKRAERKTTEVAEALAKLEAADGYAWERKPISTHPLTGEPTERSVDGAAGDLRAQAETLRTAAAHNRYYLEHGQRAMRLAQLEDNTSPADAHRLMITGLSGHAPRPEHTTALLAAAAAGQPLTVDLVS